LKSEEFGHGTDHRGIAYLRSYKQPSEPKLTLIYQSYKDRRLSWHMQPQLRADIDIYNVIGFVKAIHFSQANTG